MDKMKRAELIALAKERGLKRYSCKNKDELRQMLKDSEPKPVYKVPVLKKKVTVPAPVPASSPKKKSIKKPAISTIDDWLKLLLKVYAVDNEYIKDMKDGDKWIEKIIDEDTYNDYLEMAILDNGGHEEIGKKIYKTLLKNGRTKKSLFKEMKEYQDEGYNILFDDIIGEPNQQGS